MPNQLLLSQQTIATPFSLSGVGLHTGEMAAVKVLPAPVDTGRYFVCGDRAIPAQIGTVSATQLSTELRSDGASVRTVEHLLAALFGMGIDNALIELDQPEIPILDGSALPWVEAIAAAGVTAQAAERQLVPITQTIAVTKGDSFAIAVPSDTLRFTYGIEFDSAAIRQQWFSWTPSLEQFSTDFARDIAPARTFTLAQYIEPMRAAGLIKGGSLENAIVCDAKQWLNPPLRFADEPCRHKLLDLIGDLSLLGFLPQAHILAFKASHHLHAELAYALFEAVRRK